MSSKVSSQHLITDSFNQQKSGRGVERSKGKGKFTTASPSKSSERPAQVQSAEDVLRRKHLNTLREFDLDWRFGPCTGITRLERWERAERHGQNPSPDVKDLILQHQQDEEYCQNIWSGYPI